MLHQRGVASPPPNLPLQGEEKGRSLPFQGEESLSPLPFWEGSAEGIAEGATRTRVY